MLCLRIFSQAGPQRWVNSSASPSVCHLEMKEFRWVPFKTTQQAKFPVFSSFDLFCAERKARSNEYCFWCLWYDLTWKSNPGLSTTKRTFKLQYRLVSLCSRWKDLKKRGHIISPVTTLSSLPYPGLCYCDSCKQGYIIATNLIPVNFKNVNRLSMVKSMLLYLFKHAKPLFCSLNFVEPLVLLHNDSFRIYSINL